MLAKWINFCVRNRWGVWSIVLMLSVLSLLGLKKLHVDTSLDSLIPSMDPEIVNYDRIIKEFGTDNKAIIYIRDENLWSVETLTTLESLKDDLLSLGVIERIDSIFTAHHFKGSKDSMRIESLIPSKPWSEEILAEVKANALDHPIISGTYISHDGLSVALILSIEEQAHDSSGNNVYQSIESTLMEERYQSAFDELFQIGESRMRHELQEVFFQDIKVLVPLSVLVLIISIFVFLRSIIAPVIALMTSGLSILWTFGLIGWLDIPLNILSAMLPTLIIVIGSTEDTHMIASYCWGLSKYKDRGRITAARYMVRQMAIPLILTVITTGIGFSANIFSDIGLIRNFAILATIAIIINGVVTLYLVPILLTQAGPNRNHLFGSKGDLSGIPGGFVRLFQLAKSRYPKRVIIITGVASVFLFYWAARLYVSNDPMSYFKNDQGIVRDAQSMREHIGGSKLFYITLDAGEENAFMRPDQLKRVAKIESFIEEQGVFYRSNSMAQVIKWMNQEFHSGDVSYFDIPQNKRVIGQYIMFLHRADLESLVSEDFSRLNIIVRHDISDSRTLNKHIEELKGVVSASVGLKTNFRITGENLMINRAAETLIHGQVKSLVFLVLVIFVIMSIMFTSIKGGLIAMIPTLIPVIVMFGIMGWLDIALNPGTVMVAVITIGLAIDGTIHLLSRYNDLCRRTSDYDEALSEAVREESVPMVATSFSLALGFGLLVLSEFTLIAQFGVLSAGTILIALYVNLLVTPIIMTKVRLVGLSQILSISVRQGVLKKNPLFRDMSNYQIRKAILISELGEYQMGDFLTKEGEVARSMFLILKGRVQIVKKDKGQCQPVAVLNAGETFGEINYITATKRLADIRALTNVSVLRFDYEKMNKDLQFFPQIMAKMNFNISYIIGKKMIQLIERMPESKCTGD